MVQFWIEDFWAKGIVMNVGKRSLFTAPFPEAIRVAFVARVTSKLPSALQEVTS
jgi:hypothetical protein